MLGSGNLACSNSEDGTATDLLFSSTPIRADGGVVVYVKDGARMTLYYDGQKIANKTDAALGTFFASGITLLATGASSRNMNGEITRFRMWEGAFDDIAYDPRTYASRAHP